MEARGWILRSCSLALVLNGCNLFVRSRFGELVRSFFLLWVVAAFAWYIKDSSDIYAQRKGISFGCVSQLSNAIGLVACILPLSRRKKQVESFVRTIVPRVREQDLHRIQTEIWCLNIGLLAYNVIEVLIQLARRVIEGPDPFTLHTISWLVRFGSNWILSTTGFYLIMVRLLIASHSTLLLRATRNLSDRGSHVSFRIRWTLKSIQDTNDEFERLFSVMPFMWFMLGALTAPAGITMAKVTGLMGYLYAVFMIRLFVFPIAVTLILDHLQSALRTQVIQAQVLVLKSRAMEAMEELLVLRDLDQVADMRFTGFSFFILNKSFVLSYVGSVVTFAALIANYIVNAW